MPEENEFDDYYYECNKEHKYRDTVDAVHIFHPLRIWLVGVSFFDIEIL